MVAKIDWREITFEDASQKEKSLRELLAQMGVPQGRRDTRQIRILRWLNRNLTAVWGDHPMHDEARDKLTWLLRWEQRISRCKD